MNLLPFMTILLVILAMFSQSFVKGYRQLMIETKMYRGHYIADRKARNSVEDLYFNRTKEQPRKKRSPEKKSKEYSYVRETALFHERGRLNLYKLLKKGKENQKELYRFSGALLKRFYGHSSFWTDGLEKKILNAWVKAAKDKKGEISFTDLFVSDPALKNPLYKMIHGTGIYNLSEDEGYPPLEDVFRIEKNKKSPLYFKVAHREVLIVALGEKLYQGLREAEMQKRKEYPEKRNVSLDKSEFKALVNRGFQKDLSVLELFSFEGVANKKEIVTETDKATGQKSKRVVK